MSLGLVGRKCGMTRVFTDDGLSIPVTVIEVRPNKMTQIKTVASDGYDAIQGTKGQLNTSRLNKSQIGHMMKAGVETGLGYWEFRTDGLSESFQFPLQPSSYVRFATYLTSKCSADLSFLELHHNHLMPPF
jgi:large subunit ribosomal protein L3